MAGFHFLPLYGTNQTTTAATTTGVKNLPATGLACGTFVRVINKSATPAEVVYVRVWYSANTTEAATSADYPVAPGMVSVIPKSELADRMSVIAASGTPALEIMLGERID